MTTGALIYAFNNEQTDYVAMARWCARNIRRHLDIPVAIVSDQEIADNDPDFAVAIRARSNSSTSRYFQDYDRTLTWHNLGRPDAYSVTPWQQTLLIDADFVIASDSLKSVLQADLDFTCHRGAFNMATGQMLDELNVFGEHRLPMWWATVIIFRKSDRANFIFDSMQMVRDNWKHYRELYGINNRTYRNDFALSIAMGIVSGHTNRSQDIPWQLATVMPEDIISKPDIDEDSYVIEHTDSAGKVKYNMFRGMDFHAMGKKTLGEIIETDFRTRLLDTGNRST